MYGKGVTDIANALVNRDYDVTIVTYMDSGDTNWCGNLIKELILSIKS